MATIVRHKESGERFVVLGAGFGAYAASRPSALFGSLLPSEESGRVPVIAVCACNGVIEFIDSNSLEVLSVDDVTPALLLGDA